MRAVGEGIRWDAARSAVSCYGRSSNCGNGAIESQGDVDSGEVKASHPAASVTLAVCENVHLRVNGALSALFSAVKHTAATIPPTDHEPQEPGT